MSDFFFEMNYQYMMTNMDCYIENVNDGDDTKAIQKKGSIIVRLIDGIKKIFEKIIDGIHKFIHRNEVSGEPDEKIQVNRAVISQSKELKEYTNDIKPVIQDTKNTGKIKNFIKRHPIASTALATAVGTTAVYAYLTRRELKSIYDDNEKCVTQLRNDMTKLQKKYNDMVNKSNENLDKYVNERKKNNELKMELDNTQELLDDLAKKFAKLNFYSN